MNKAGVIYRNATLFLCWIAFVSSVSFSVGGEMIRVPAATVERVDGATQVPVRVALAEFLISATEVTQAEYLEVVGTNPALVKGDQKPVENVTWWDAIRFCNLKSLREGLEPCYNLATGECSDSCSGYRLPTEAEWERAKGKQGERSPEEMAEFAYLGPSQTKSIRDLMEHVNKGTQAVGGRTPNAFGIYDMLGNVWEWCNDFNDPDRETLDSFVQPAGPAWGPERVLRGGSYATIQGHWSRSFRSSMLPEFKSRFTGFRVVRRTGEGKGTVAQPESHWFQTFNQAPQGFEDNLGDLSPLVGSDPLSIDAWEMKREALKAKWENLLGIPTSDPLPPDTRLIKTIHHRHYTGKLMYLRVEPDSWEKVFLMMPRRPLEEPTPVVIVPYYDVDVPAGENLGGRSFRPVSVRSFAYLLVRQGYIAVAVRWFGESYGENYNEAVANLKTRHPRCTGLGKWVWDARRLLDYLCTLPQVDQDRIGMIGHSLGAKMTLYAAALDDRIDLAVFSEGGIGLQFSNYEDYWYWGEAIRTIPQKTDHHELLGLIAPRPFLLIGGDDADNDQSWHFVNAARQVYEIYGESEAIGYFNHRSGHSPTPESVHLALEWFKFFFDGSR